MRTGTASFPRPGSSASRAPVLRVGLAPARAEIRDAGDGRATPDAPRSRATDGCDAPPTHGRDDENETDDRHHAEPEHEHVDVEPGIGFGLAGYPERKGR